ncbi:MAG: MBL fold metallo-hydrolase, partial [Candidatus Helarchaeota archaeon]
MKLTILGTSGSTISKTRGTPSFLIDKDLLLDCSEGTTRKLLEINGHLKDLEKILISHVHADHIMGIVTLLWRLWLVEERKRVLEIIGPPETEKVIEGFLSLTHTPRQAFNFKIKYTKLEGDEEIKLGRISAMRVTHHIDTYAYRIDRDKSVCYCTDTIPLEKISVFAKNCDILLHEASMPESYEKWAHKYFHSTPKDAAIIASNAGVKKLIIFHFM